jgi:hypothetical protein
MNPAQIVVEGNLIVEGEEEIRRNYLIIGKKKQENEFAGGKSWRFMNVG